MSKRKPHNARARLQRSCQAIVRSNRLAVYNFDHLASKQHCQGLIEYTRLRPVRTSHQIIDALCDFPHRWTIYASGLCVGADGVRYVKSVEVTTEQAHKVAQIDDVIESFGLQVLDTCNPAHLVASAWIAIPDDVSLDEELAAQIYEAVGAWPS